MWKSGIHFVAVGAAALLFAALAPGAMAAERVFYVQAIEPKGGAPVKEEPFPAEALPPGGGYVLNAPDPKGRWLVSAYMWSPSQIVVRKGDRVTLQILGIHGAKHTVSIEHYHPQLFAVKRGHVTTVRFTADRPGRFQVKCFEHQPSMTGEIIVLE